MTNPGERSFVTLDITNQSILSLSLSGLSNVESQPFQNHTHTSLVSHTEWHACLSPYHCMKFDPFPVHTVHAYAILGFRFKHHDGL